MRLRKEDLNRAEDNIAPTRSGRYYEATDGWYFKTREGISVGPYPDRFDAELSASLLISRLAQLEVSEDPRAAIRRFQDDPAVGPIARHMGGVSRADLDELLRSYRVDQRKQTLRKAWKAVSRYLPRPEV